mmetsp:Transcript_29856/g.41293  ORF Transcript_29856/g.41293 Transcript_29856/m.41293 type:complete len:408 (+) Transcript_29856:173-1396(+)
MLTPRRILALKLTRLIRTCRFRPKVLVWIIMAWSGLLLFFAGKTIIQLSVEQPGWLLSKTEGLVRIPGSAGLVQTGHLWCCHGPFLCQRAPFLTQTNVEGSEGGEGLAMQPGECACELGYVGEGCAPECGGCSGHGYCLHPNECSCAPGWIGDSCKDPLCLTPCFKGACTAPGICTCQKNYHGPMCDVYCDKHGFYIGDDRYAHTQGLSKKDFDLLARTQCKCIEGWEGRWCDEPVCSSTKCQHGFCVAPDKCQCKPGWTGADCNVVPSQGKFLFTDKDIGLQRDRKFKEDLEEFKAQSSKLKHTQKEYKEHERDKRKEGAAAWKPAWLTGGGKVQSRGGLASIPKFPASERADQRRAPGEPSYMSQESLAQLQRVQKEEPEPGVRIGKGGGARSKSFKLSNDKLPF